MSSAHDRRPRPIAGTIGLIFAGLGSVLGALALSPVLRFPVAGAGALVSLVLIVLLWRWAASTAPEAGLFKRRAYLLAVLLEVLAIYVVSGLLARYGLKSYLIEAVGVIVGLHFIGLWRATALSRFLWIAGGMCVLSALAALLPAAWNGFNPRDAAAGFANAVVLWIGAGRSPTRRET